MPIPDFESLMLPLLELLGNGKEHSLRELIPILEDKFKLTEDERKTLLPSGQQPIFHNRVGWARTYMKKAGLLEASRRGLIRITERGKEVLNQKPQRIDVTFLKQFEEFQDFLHAKHRAESDDKTPTEAEEKTPEELLANAYENLKRSVLAELLDNVKTPRPSSSNNWS